MRKEDGLSIISLIFIIVVLGIILVVAAKMVFGKDGIVDRFKEADDEYNKTEIVDKLNLVIKEKYIFDSKYALENKKNVQEICNSEAFFGYLLDKGYIEELKDINDNLVENQYYINANTLNSDIATNVINENGSKSNGTKIYKLKKIEDKYLIYFVDKYGDEQELGELVMNPEV